MNKSQLKFGSYKEIKIAVFKLKWIRNFYYIEAKITQIMTKEKKFKRFSHTWDSKDLKIDPEFIWQSHENEKLF